MYGRTDNSRSLELKFEDKTEMRLTRSIEKDNKTVFKAVKLDIGNQNRNNDENSTVVRNTEQERNQKRDKITEQKNDKGANATVTTQTIHRTDTPSGDNPKKTTVNPQRIKGKKDEIKYYPAKNSVQSSITSAQSMTETGKDTNRISR